MHVINIILLKDFRQCIVELLLNLVARNHLTEDEKSPQALDVPAVLGADHKLSSKLTFCHPGIKVDEHFHEPSETTLLSVKAAWKPPGPTILVTRMAITLVVLGTPT